MYVFVKIIHIVQVAIFLFQFSFFWNQVNEIRLVENLIEIRVPKYRKPRIALTNRW